MLDILGQLPPETDAAVLVVQHIPPHTESGLHRVLAPATRLRVRQAEHGIPLESGTVYTAVANHHLLVEGDTVMVTPGPRENHWRPSIDALFRSAAYAYRERTVGVILSGTLNDGTSGLWRIKRFGGVALAQDRSEAAFPDMIVSADKYVELDAELPAKTLGQHIAKLISTMPNSTPPHTSPEEEDFTRFEIDVAIGKNALKRGVLDYGTYSPLTCPECHGALTEYAEGKIRRYRCHTGHAHSSESLLAGIDENIERSTWEVMRGMEESQLLLNHLADSLAEQDGQSPVVAAYRARAAELADRSQRIKEMIFAREKVKPLNSATEAGGGNRPQPATS